MTDGKRGKTEEKGRKQERKKKKKKIQIQSTTCAFLVDSWTFFFFVISSNFKTKDKIKFTRKYRIFFNPIKNHHKKSANFQIIDRDTPKN